MHEQHRQSGSLVRVEQGLAGALTVVEGSAAVVVDVLSFSTAVSVAVDGGGRVWPCPWSDRGRAEALARDHDAVLAAGRSRAGTGGVSLSPVSVRAAAPARRVLQRGLTSAG